jgi:RNA polymerase sigma-70 factor (ECF subfamily)
MSEAAHLLQPSAASDEDLVAGVRAGDMALFEEIMRRYNQRLYRVARAIVKDEDEAEDVMQQAYIQAYLHLDSFAGRSRFSTWLTRIAIHEALGRRRGRQATMRALEDDDTAMDHVHIDSPDPERLAYAGELRALIESSIDALPEPYRLVFMCRDVEGLSTAETCAALDLGEEAVKTRLHRARAALRRELFARAGSSTAQAFEFHLSRCDRVVQAVRQRLAELTR